MDDAASRALLQGSWPRSTLALAPARVGGERGTREGEGG